MMQQPMRLNTWRVLIEACFLVGAAALGITIAVWALDDEAPYVYHEVNAKIEPNPATAGGRVTVTWPVTINRLCPAQVHRSLRNAENNRPLQQYDPTPSALTVQMGDPTIEKTFELPVNLPPTVKYQAKVCFRCNPLHTIFPICVDTPSLFFRVNRKPE